MDGCGLPGDRSNSSSSLSPAALPDAGVICFRNAFLALLRGDSEQSGMTKTSLSAMAWDRVRLSETVASAMDLR